MPVYEFFCRKCHLEFKTLRAADRVADVTCPTCGTPKIARLLSVTAQTKSDDGACAFPTGGG